jgi:putative tricarboxylic transport membrane protein
MDLFAHLAIGFEQALTAQNLAFCFVGVLIGTMVGVLPGLGPLPTIAMLLPITFGVPPTAALIMLAGIYYGAQYGGSTTAILLNLPGEASSVVTAIDGHQIARRGKAGVALFTAAVGSFFAGTVATFLIAGFAPSLALFALRFGPAEYFSLMVLGLAASVALAHGSVLKAIAMVVLGLLLGTVGQDIYTGVARFDFGFENLVDGFNFVAIAMGVFGIGEIMRNLEKEREQTIIKSRVRDLIPSREELKAIVAPILRGTALGSALGILPGGGAILGSFAAYSLERRIAKEPQRFGHGAIEGVAAPESANNAAAQTSFIPMLTLGIPSNPVMALMVGALLINGIVPGPNLMTQRPELFWGVIASMWIGNLMLVILNLPLISVWVKFMEIPYRVLFPGIVAVCCIGVFSLGNNSFDVYVMAGFAVLGYLLVKLDCEPAPLLLGFVIGRLLEEHLRRAMLLSRGDPSVFVDVNNHPISAALIVFAVAALVLVCWPAIGRKRAEAFRE